MQNRMLDADTLWKMMRKHHKTQKLRTYLLYTNTDDNLIIEKIQAEQSSRISPSEAVGV